MIFGLDDLARNPAAFLLVFLLRIVAVLIALTLHELCHGLVATRLGDPTPIRQGRLTLNPISHLDPAGTILLLFAGFGWAKPIQVNPMYFSGNRIQKMALVGAAGPTSNFVQAFIFALPFMAGLLSPNSNVLRPLASLPVSSLTSPMELLTAILTLLVIINVSIGLFNLIPVPPLDGARILPAFLPRSAAASFYRFEPWGVGILLVFFMVDAFFLRGAITSRLLGPPVFYIAGFLLTFHFF